MMIGDAFGAKLHPGVGLRPLAEQLELHLQLEVAERLRRAEELVARHHLLQRAADDAAVLDAPGVLRVALPAGQRLAVEQRLRFTAGLRRNGKGQKQEAGDGPAHAVSPSGSRVGSPKVSIPRRELRFRRRAAWV